jgi:sugar phosphate isomerase/epimerase
MRLHSLSSTHTIQIDILSREMGQNMSQQIQLLCSTGAFSRDPDYTDYRAVLEYGPQLEVDGFELLFYPAWYPELEHIATDLQRSGLKFPVVHTEKNIGVALGKAQASQREQGVRWLHENCRLGSRLGTQIMVLHLWGWPELDDNLDNNLERLHECIDIAVSYGIELAIETIPCRQSDPLTNIHRAVERDERSRVALDTEFLARHGQIETVFKTEWIWPLIRHVHIKDYDGQGFHPDGRRKYLHPGQGHIDFPHFFQGLKQRNFAGFISLEAPAIDQQGHVNVERLQESLDFIHWGIL